MNRYFRILVLVILANGVLTGCATITRGTTEAFQVKTDPSGADVRLSSGETCKTPCTLEKKRKHNFTVFIEKPGYEDTHVSVVSQVSGSGAAGMAGNVIFGGIIGAGVDAGTGATKELVPNPVEVALNPVEDTESASLGNSDAGEVDDAEYSQISRQSARTDDSPEPKDQPEQGLIARLDEKVHESIQGADYIWLDIEWINGFQGRQIEMAQGELEISQKGSGREVTIPWNFEQTLAPGAEWLAEDSGFEIKDTRPLKWLMKAKTEDLKVTFEPNEIHFSDGSIEAF